MDMDSLLMSLAITAIVSPILYLSLGVIFLFIMSHLDL